MSARAQLLIVTLSLLLVALVAISVELGRRELRDMTPVRLRAECQRVGVAQDDEGFWQIWQCPGDQGTWWERMHPWNLDPNPRRGADPETGA